MPRSEAPHDFRLNPNCHAGPSRWQRREHGTRTWRTLVVRELATAGTRSPGGRLARGETVDVVERTVEWEWQ